MKALQLLTFPLAAFVCAAGARAQGGNDCSSPTTVSGFGTFLVNTAGATDSSQQPGTCAPIHNDVWFRWTAAATGGVQIDLCGTASVDTVIAVYTGSSCPVGNALTCNDDACALQSQLNFSATAGTTYLVQIGAYNAGTTYSGSFEIIAGNGGCPSQSVGPDVIVGDITDVLNTSVANGLDALALGTTSCNVGDTPVQWQASNPQHPVIGGALYRHKVVNGAGRFEQIGQSWLKHGFAALAGNVCCSCNNPGTQTLLGVGCSDPYGAGLNGSQGGLGPRWQVNAHTGVFTYPPANPSWTGTGRLCEVDVNDLEPSSTTVHFYGECVYVTADDAAAGNNDNNASYRSVSVTGSGEYTFGVTGTTQRQMQAIRAWPIVEPGVTLTDVHVAGDGLFVVGSHATNLGGGQYHYEYAVLNMNSDRNGGSFSVPFAPGTVITNVGFHDVAYRNGDGPGNVNFSGTDWTPTIGASSISWACQTQAANASANALRWSTTYNFRFDANVAPQSGLVTLGLWKPGTPTSVTAAADVPGVPTTFAYCFGDGSGAACPCGNAGAAGNGCANSVNASGAHLAASGTPSIAADTFTLTGSGMPATSSVLYFQGTTQTAGGAGAAFGDGLRCASGSVVRLGQKVNSSGASSIPSGADPAIHVTGAVASGAVRTYQAWYRNTAAFCQPEGFNLTNAVQATWAP